MDAEILLKKITDADWNIFEDIAQRCESKWSRTINVASKRRSEAIVAVWKVLKELRES